MSLFAGLFDKFLTINQKLERSVLLTSIRRGLTYMVPLLLIGSFALIFISLPIPSYQSMMKGFFGSQWDNIMRVIRDGTFNVLSLFMVLFISYAYATEKREQLKNMFIHPVITAGVSLCSFVMLTEVSTDGFSIVNFGVTNVFLAIFVTVFSSAIFVRLCSLKFLKVRTYTDGANTSFSQAMVSIWPAVITILIFAGINHFFVSILGISDLKGFFANILIHIMNGMPSQYLGALLFVFLIHILWFMGIHGSNVLEPVTQTLFVSAMTLNTTLVTKGMPPTEIFTKTFFDTFVLIGGCGSTLALICAIIITARHKNLKRLAKISFIPVLFNINEIMTFGIPVVLNPVYFIPFIFTPLLLMTVSYFAMSAGLVPYTVHTVEWTTPIFLSGYASTGSIAGSILQLINLILGVFCYLPFVKLSERAAALQMKKNLDKIYKILDQNEERSSTSGLLRRQDEVGNLARFITSDLKYDFKNSKFMLFYQPQLDHTGHVFGAEALLRWKHDLFGYIYPPLAISLAEESQMIDELGDWIIETACCDQKALNDRGIHDVVISINVSAIQLENEQFIPHLKETLDAYQVRPDSLKIEITEQVALSGSKKIVEQILGIKKLGIKLAMDDFGMGHSSLMYLKEYDFDTIKLDGSLVREMLTNNNCNDIISSIVYLSQSMQFSIIAEYVEKEEQREALHKLGCDQYQGYLYSPAVPFDGLMDYIKKAGK